MAYADRVGALYVLAQDPDADRFTAAEKVTAAYTGSIDSVLSAGVPGNTWRIFPGDQLGALFAYRALNAYKSTGNPLGE